MMQPLIVMIYDVQSHFKLALEYSWKTTRRWEKLLEARIKLNLWTVGNPKWQIIMVITYFVHDGSAKSL